MQISKTVGRVFDLVRNDKRDSSGRFVIPYGRHSYGTQPEIVTIDPKVALQKARGSKVGNFCSIASGLKFTFLGRHNYNWVSTYPFYEFYDKWKVDSCLYHEGALDFAKIPPNPIIIENDVWIAHNVTIMEGVRVCNGAVVAMGSLITKDVPPYAIFGGNPARIIKYRFSNEQINECLKIAWWNWEDKDIARIVPFLLSDNIDAFIREAKKIRPCVHSARVLP